MSGICSTSPVPNPSYLSTYNGAACMILKDSKSIDILGTCCNTTINNIEYHALSNWTGVGSMPQTFGETVSHLDGTDCIYNYCNITYTNASEATKAKNWFSSCMDAKFPSKKNTTQCVIASQGQTLPSGSSLAVTVSKTGLMMFLIATVAMTV